MSELLASALNRRADLVKRHLQLSDRIMAVVTSQEGEDLTEDPNDLLAEAEAVASQLAKLIAKINHTNAETVITVAGADGEADDITLTEALARKDELAMRRKLVSGAADQASRAGRHGLFGGRSRASELKTIVNVSVPRLRAQADDLARQYREVDLAIQKTNFTTDLLS